MGHTRLDTVAVAAATPDEPPDRPRAGLALTARNRYGAVKRHHPDNLELLADARRELAAAKLEDYISRTLADAPPLCTDQLERLAGLLRGGQHGG